jgi:Flp pilus assembly protein TadD
MPTASLRLIVTPLLAGTLAVSANAGDVRISIPKRTKPTPVQKLNQEGVKEIEKHDYKKAKATFYKAYLIDPDDPFTLNNLGYIAELDGQADRAQRYYALAQQRSSDAVVYKSTDRDALGKSVNMIAGNAADANMEVNRLNVQAIALLQKNKAPQADLALQKALKLDPQNPFTLNNLGFAKEKEGELEDAHSYYVQAASQKSDASVLVTTNPSWRGKGISEVASANANKVTTLMSHEQDVSARVARLNTRGVAAINRNDYKLAQQYFQEAYQLDPKNAFAMNNMGYLAELDGDRETADYYYEKARTANQSSLKVAYATRKDMEGAKLAAVARASDDAVVKATEEAAAARRAQGGPVVLRYRNNQPVIEPPTPPQPTTANPPSPRSEVLPPLPDNEQPSTQQQPQVQSPSPDANPSGGLLVPLPDSQQPPTATEPDRQQQNSDRPQ